MQRDVRRPVAAFELLAGAARAWIVAARIGRLVELSQSFQRGATGKPVGMDVASRGGAPAQKGARAAPGFLPPPAAWPRWGCGGGGSNDAAPTQWRNPDGKTHRYPTRHSVLGFAAQ